MTRDSEWARDGGDVVLDLLRETALSTAAAESFPDALSRALDIVCRHAGWSVGHAWRRIPDSPTQLSSTGIWKIDSGTEDDVLRRFRDRTEKVHFGLGEGLIGRVWREADPTWVEDAREIEEFTQRADEGELPIRSGCVVPVVVDEEVEAVLEFWAREVVPEDPRLMLAMEAVAAHLATSRVRDRAIDPSVLERRQLRSLLEHVEEVFSLVDREGEVLYRNPGWERVLGYDEESLHSIGGFKIVHPDDLEAVKSLHVEAMDHPGSRVGPILVRVRASDGVWREGEVTVVNLLEDPKVRATIFNYRDVTDREIAERRLATRARQQEAVAELGRMALRGVPVEELTEEIVETVSRVLDVEYAKVLELVPDESHLVLRAGVGWREGLVGEATVPADERSQAGYTLRRSSPVVVESLPGETRFEAPDLLVDHDVESALSVVIAGAGERPFGVLGAGTYRTRSFTEHDARFLQAIADVLGQAVERRRVMREIRFRSDLLDTIGQAVVASDLEGNVTYWNRAAQEHFGWSREEAMGRNVMDLTTPDEAHPEAAEIMEELRRGEKWEGEFDLLRRDGTTFPGLVSDVAIRDPEGRLIGVVGVMTDLTELKELEERVHRAERMEAIGRLAGGVAHDFNNLLTAILGYVDLARDGSARSEDVGDDLDEVESAARRAMSLTRQLLAYSRQQVMQPEVLELNRVIEGIEEMIRRLIGEHIAFTVDLDPEAGHVRVDPGQIEQVILNLAVNARDAMPGGGELRVETGRVELTEAYVQREVVVEPGDYAILMVSDTGVGMDEETRAHAFDPFFTTKPGARGTGLGLSTVKGIIEQSGGHVWIYSDPGRGTTFRIYLPRVSEPAETSAKPGEEVDPHGRETVLVVEDEDAVRRLACTVLRNLGYDVLEAADGEEALEVAAGRESGVDLLFTDMVMPGMRGSELARRIREDHPEARVLLTSGYAGEDPRTSRGLGDVDYPILSKPYTPAELGRRVREALGEG